MFLELDPLLEEIFQESPVCNNHLKNGSVEDIDVLRKFGYITVSDGMNHLVITITPSGADFWKNGGFKNIEKKKSEDNEIKKMQSEFNRLQAENLRLQNEELKYKKKVRFWEIASAVLGLIATALAIFK